MVVIVNVRDGVYAVRLVRALQNHINGTIYIFLIKVTIIRLYLMNRELDS